MKRTILILLSATLILSAILCGCQKQDDALTEQTTGSTTTTETSQTPVSQETTEQSTEQSTEQPETPDVPAADDMTTEEIVNKLAEIAGIGTDAMMVMPMEQGQIGNVVGDFEFSPSFQEGTWMCPTFSTSPFDLAVIRLAPEQDATAFAADMEAHANLNKGICVSADVAKALVKGQTVVFLMCKQKQATALENAFYQLFN